MTAATVRILFYKQIGVRDAHFAEKFPHQSRVHVCAAGLSQINQSCSFALKWHLEKKNISRKQVPVPVAELITNDHTVLSLCYFMETFSRAEGLLLGFYSMVKPQQLIIDRSKVQLLSIICVYNLESLQDYLEPTFQIVTRPGTAKDLGKLSQLACTSHVMNLLQKVDNKVYVWFG